jgi:MFS family permease
MQIVPQGTGIIIIGQDIFILGIILGVVLMGILIGYIIWQRNHREKPRYQYTIFQTRGYHTEKFFIRLRNRRFKAVVIATIWVLFLLFVLPVLELYVQDIITDISALFLIISFIFGFYSAYPLTTWIDWEIPTTGSAIWMRRIIAVLMVLAGLGVTFLWLMSPALVFVSSAIQGVTTSPFISFMSLMVLIAGFFVGIAVFGAYMEFKFEQRAGGFAFHGRQRFSPKIDK